MPAPLCSVFSSYSPIEARIVSGMLEDAGIECVLSNEFFAVADNPVSNASGGVQVFVRAVDADEARALLAEAGRPQEDNISKEAASPPRENGPR